MSQMETINFFDVQSMLFVKKIPHTYAATILKPIKIIYSKKLSSCFLSFNPIQENEEYGEPRQEQFLIRAYFFKKKQISPHLFSYPFRNDQEYLEKKCI